MSENERTLAGDMRDCALDLVAATQDESITPEVANIMYQAATYLRECAWDHERAQPASVADGKENTFREGAPFGSGKCESMSDAIMLVENGWWRDDENVEWVPAAAFRTAVSEIVRLEALLYPVPIPQPPRDIVSVIENVVRAARALRDSQRAYMADRGNEALGKIVGERAADLDAALAAAPQSAKGDEE